MTAEETLAGVFTTETGTFLLPVENGNDPLLPCIKNNLTFDPYVIDCIRPFALEGTTVIDVGANYGQMSLQFSKMVGETGHVHSFECSEFISFFLKKTMGLNDHASNVTIHTEAVWNVPGIDLKMLKPDGSVRGLFYSGMGIKGSADRDTRDMDTHAVISTTIDSYEYATPVSVIKVDAQGSDFFAIIGAEGTIRKYHPMIIFEYEAEYDSIFDVSFERLDQWLVSLGYQQRPDLLNNGHDFVYTYKAEV